MESFFFHCLLTFIPRYRFNLEVAQQPIHGRRKTEKDRRPLAHCPIVRLRARECHRIINTVMEIEGREEGWEETDVDVR